MTTPKVWSVSTKKKQSHFVTTHLLRVHVQITASGPRKTL